MHDREQNRDDLPWNDAPADSEAPSGSEEPEPAEVAGEEGEEYDTAGSPVPDPYEKYQPESLDDRLAEEEPDRGVGGSPDALAGGLVDPNQGGGEVYRAEEDDDLDDVDEPGAEDAAIHIRDDTEV
jgi:hypothetical protein